MEEYERFKFQGRSYKRPSCSTRSIVVTTVEVDLDVEHGARINVAVDACQHFPNRYIATHPRLAVRVVTHARSTVHAATYARSAVHAATHARSAVHVITYARSTAHAI